MTWSEFDDERVWWLAGIGEYVKASVWQVVNDTFSLVVGKCYFARCLMGVGVD